MLGRTTGGGSGGADANPSIILRKGVLNLTIRDHITDNLLDTRLLLRGEARYLLDDTLVLRLLLNDVRSDLLAKRVVEGSEADRLAVALIVAIVVFVAQSLACKRWRVQVCPRLYREVGIEKASRRGWLEWISRSDSR